MKKFDNFMSHLNILAHSGEQDLENEFVLSGIISKFAIQFELGWKVLKELLRYEGAGDIGSPRAVLKAAYQYFDFIDEDIWLSMLRDRNNSAHVYDGGAARELAATIIRKYIPEFERVGAMIEKKYSDVMFG